MINAFLPIRKGSQRIINKNIKKFAGIQGGLTKLKIQQLINVRKINKIIVSTNCDKVIDLAKKFSSSKVIVDIRPDEYANSKTTTDDLIKYAAKKVNSEIILWTHVTSPFFDENLYSDAIKQYENRGKEFDSLMSVNEIQNFILIDKKPFNYNLKSENWPFTQSIKPIHEINNAVFICNKKFYKESNNRIGNNPILYTTDKISSIDIDWQEDFLIAEKIYKSKK